MKLYRLAFAVGSLALLWCASAQAACTLSHPAPASPWSSTTRLDTMTSDAVNITGGCIDGVTIGGNAPVTFPLPDTLKSIASPLYTQTYYAPAYRTAVWDGASGHDVGPAINAAIAACATAGGGIVQLPLGTYYVATQLRNTIPKCGVHAGVSHGGSDIDDAATTLKWNGTADAVMAVWGPDADAIAGVQGSNQDLTGLTLDCNSIAGTSLQAQSITWSKLHVRTKNCTTANVVLTTVDLSTNSDMQHNDISIDGGNYDITTGKVVVVQADVTGAGHNNGDVSLNDISIVVVNNGTTDGVTVGTSDTNKFHKLMVYQTSGNGIIFGGSSSGPNAFGSLNNSVEYLSTQGAAVVAQGTDSFTYASRGTFVGFYDDANNTPAPTIHAGANITALLSGLSLAGGVAPATKFMYGYLGNYNSAGKYPAQAFSFATANNFSNGSSEIDIWNTNYSGGGFRFYQLTAASAATLLGELNGSGHLKLPALQTSAAVQASTICADGSGNIIANSIPCLAPKVRSATPANPTGTTSTTTVFMGLNITIAPQTTGVLALDFVGDAFNDTINDGGTITIRYGTGSAPVNGDASGAVGTQCGSQIGWTSAAASEKKPFAVRCIVSGLTVGTTYWYDLSIKAVTGGTASVENITSNAVEIK